MPRAKHPKPYQIAVGLSRQGWRLPEGAKSIGHYTLARLYDRTTGNFKGVGWWVKVTYRFPNQDGVFAGQPVEYAEVPLMDRFIPNYVQSTL